MPWYRPVIVAFLCTAVKGYDYNYKSSTASKGAASAPVKLDANGFPTYSQIAGGQSSSQSSNFAMNLLAQSLMGDQANGVYDPKAQQQLALQQQKIAAVSMANSNLRQQQPQGGNGQNNMRQFMSGGHDAPQSQISAAIEWMKQHHAPTPPPPPPAPPSMTRPPPAEIDDATDRSNNMPSMPAMPAMAPAMPAPTSAPMTNPLLDPTEPTNRNALTALTPPPPLSSPVTPPSRTPMTPVTPVTPMPSISSISSSSAPSAPPSATSPPSYSNSNDEESSYKPATKIIENMEQDIAPPLKKTNLRKPPSNINTPVKDKYLQKLQGALKDALELKVPTINLSRKKL